MQAWVVTSLRAKISGVRGLVEALLPCTLHLCYLQPVLQKLLLRRWARIPSLYFRGFSRCWQSWWFRESISSERLKSFNGYSKVDLDLHAVRQLAPCELLSFRNIAKPAHCAWKKRKVDQKKEGQSCASIHKHTCGNPYLIHERWYVRVCCGCSPANN